MHSQDCLLAAAHHFLDQDTPNLDIFFCRSDLLNQFAVGISNVAFRLQV